jgi:gamma-resorcylate decarboxylase
LSLDGKIALEEHFAIPGTLQDSAVFAPERYRTVLNARLLDVADGRLREMDAHGVEMMVVSLNAPAVQALHDLLGHLGEGLPISMGRIDNRNAWVEGSRGHKAQHPIAYHFYRDVHLTTSGNFGTQSLVDAILEIGSDLIMFSTDWPFENVEHAAKWFDAAAISENDRFKIGRVNAAKLLKLAVRS